jgi:hypothetical protein
MRDIGFSTGALAKSDVRKALRLSCGLGTGAVEYSALRFEELSPLVEFLLKEGPGDYRYSSFHAPSQFKPEDEKAVVELLWKLIDRHAMHIVVHPDVISDHGLWRKFGTRLCVENMDHRKPVGRTADELEEVFEKLPEARLCFDIGHAHEIDRSMSRAYEILKRFRNRIAHIHASEVSDECAHRAFSPASAAAFRKVAGMIPDNVPVILETVTPDEKIGTQMEEAGAIFGQSKDSGHRPVSGR